MKQQALKYWQSLKEQEQKLLIVASIVFVIFVLVMGVFKPLSAAVEKAQKDKLRQQELVAWVNNSVAQLKQSAVISKTGKTSNLSILVNRTRGQHQVNISKMQPSEGALRLTIDSVEFNKLIAWLDELTNKHGVKIESLDLAQDNLPGYVRVSRLLLEN
ncbi:Type II secretion system protein M [Pseudoalteromonas holothuriae]|uniref:Type II secretion system protein M n=1 Tax=Pseudoalteromonas holothuriae TaxID=2963714 RepID=A0A9W4VVW4_9GAMM|nr:MULTISPECIES: type II secretion system protein M [unclassified Pseudoalteromonas]CAH9066508.1 Type II secretion system protein M [Pseudoalteromonas sp. CIP111854]CAH9067559.1 Type II secretion system protein M [Pseudoalteromonas sp. CIP111951]